MFSTLRTRFGIPGVISVIALVFAMFGGAYAASNSSGGGKATASAKAKKGPRGPKGATGPAGPAGAQGPVGPAGAKGDAGAAGSAGTPGSPGAPGKSVTTGNATLAECPLGGATVQVEGESATKKKICNGQTGFTETLPSKKTEMGSWGMFVPPGGGGNVASISFPIPLASALDGDQVLGLPLGYNGEDEATEEHENCPGSTGNPQAKPGFLCVYTGMVAGSPLLETEGIQIIFNPGSSSVFEGGASTAGAGLVLLEEAGGVISGTFAVTAP
jgi:hypothetical protein